MKYIYPKIPARVSTPFFRIGGNGLANCLFVYGKAIVDSHIHNAKIITPTWLNFSIGSYLRKQRDKRHYLGLFMPKDEINSLRKIYLLLFKRKTKNRNEFLLSDDSILIEEGIYDFFKPILNYHEIIREHIITHLQTGLLDVVDKYKFEGCVAVHIRLGDFPDKRRTSLKWYEEQIRKHADKNKILLFSDGSDEELQEIINVKNVKRVFFGGSIQDIIAMSRCCYLIGSDSSFSAWAAFLGQVPCIFYRLQFGQILVNSANQVIMNK